MVKDKSKNTNQFACQNCGATYTKWMGRCQECSSWNTVHEETTATVKLGFSRGQKSAPGGLASLISIDEALAADDFTQYRRLQSGVTEFDRVSGGGLVQGSFSLITGDPGIGKSTLLIQICAGFICEGARIVYFSGEETVRQIGLRANRISVFGKNAANLKLGNETNVRTIVETVLSSDPRADVVIVDSIQTLFDPEISSAPGSVSQVRESAALLLQLAKTHGISIVATGHVTKEGQLAGPRVLEHLVDAVYSLEGDPQTGLRILRSSKNRFGSTGEIGLFVMQEQGLEAIPDMSQFMLQYWSQEANGVRPAGVCHTVSIEGSRPLLTEIQALTMNSNFGAAKRVAAGVDYNRLSILLAVLEKRAGLQISNHDVYLSLIGGLKIQDPALDLAAAAAIYSAFLNRVNPKRYIWLGEIGLSGEVRRIQFLGERLKEAIRLGLSGAIAPFQNKESDSKALQRIVSTEFTIQWIKNVREIANFA